MGEGGDDPSLGYFQTLCGRNSAHMGLGMSKTLVKVLRDRAAWLHNSLMGYKNHGTLYGRRISLILQLKVHCPSLGVENPRC